MSCRKALSVWRHDCESESWASWKLADRPGRHCRLPGRYGFTRLARRLSASGARDGERIWCFTRKGHDWSDRVPAILDAASRLKLQSFLIDGEAVVADRTVCPNSMPAQSTAHARGYVFDLIEVQGDDLRNEKLGARKQFSPRCSARWWHSVQPTPWAGRRGGVRSCLPHGPRRHSVIAAWTVNDVARLRL